MLLKRRRVGRPIAQYPDVVNRNASCCKLGGGTHAKRMRSPAYWRGGDAEATEAGLEELSNKAGGRFEAVTRRREGPVVARLGCELYPTTLD